MAGVKCKEISRNANCKHRQEQTSNNNLPAVHRDFLKKQRTHNPVSRWSKDLEKRCSGRLTGGSIMQGYQNSEEDIPPEPSQHSGKLGCLDSKVYP